MPDQDSAEQQPLLPVSYDSSLREGGILSIWRENVARVLESRRLHTFVLILIAIDAGCVIAEIAHGLLVDGCTPDLEEPAWLQFLGTLSLAITTFFLVEIPLALWAFGTKYYLPSFGVVHAPLHLFDAVIVVATFVLEFVLKGKERELVELLVILRLWRIVKLVGGIAVGAGEVEEQVSEELELTKRQLEGTTTALAKAREENRKLRARVVWLETGGSEGVEL